MLSLALLLLLQDKKEEKKPEPKALFAAPLSVKPGAATKVLIRGLALEQASGLRVSGGEAKIRSKGKAAVPNNQEAALYGDTQVELEVTPAAGAAEVGIEIVTPAGTAPKHALPVLAAAREKEPNGGFAQAQALEPGAWVEGAIGAARDVDVFRLPAKAGETWIVEVAAAGRGSPLDPLLLAHDGAGRQIASCDDVPGGRDPALTLTAPADGTCYVTLLDAHDQGGPTHAWLLRARKLER